MKNFIKEFITVIFVDPILALIIYILKMITMVFIALYSIKGDNPGTIVFEIRTRMENNGTAKNIRNKNRLFPLTAKALNSFADIIGL